MHIVNTTRRTTLAENVTIAKTFSVRLIGLLSRSSFAPGEAMVFGHCDCVHTFFMKFPIDVVFVNKKNTVVRMYHALRPFRLSKIHPFCYAIELPAGTLEKTATAVGDEITFSP